MRSGGRKESQEDILCKIEHGENIYLLKVN